MLLKDEQLKRNNWALGLETHVFPSSDGRVCKVEINVSKRDGTKLFLRPVSEIVLLISPKMDSKQ